VLHAPPISSSMIFITLIIVIERINYKARYYANVLHYPLTAFLSVPNILLSTLFSIIPSHTPPFSVLYLGQETKFRIYIKQHCNSLYLELYMFT
jgi:hypothetical protein